MSLDEIKPAQSVPDDLNGIVEIAAHSSSVKYEMDKSSGLLSVDRFMPTSMFYPCNYCFLPNTLAADGDPVDILVVTPAPIQPGSLIRVRALGVLRMKDEAGEDSKILTVPIPKVCSQYAHIQKLEDLPPLLLESIAHFFQYYKALEPGKWVEIRGWAGIDEAIKEIHVGMAHHR